MSWSLEKSWLYYFFWRRRRGGGGAGLKSGNPTRRGRGTKPKKSIPPPFTNISEKRVHVPAYKTELDFEDDEKNDQRIGATKNISSEESEKQNDAKVDEDWQTWDSG